MTISEINARSLLRKQKRIDSWFLSQYHLNLYRGCMHNCSYCDGRAERYQVAGEFGRDIEVKSNAKEILRRELDPARRRIPLKRAYMLLGGGVNDSYQPVEQKYLLARESLKLLGEFGFPVHILTKSTLVLRDIDQLHTIHEKSQAIVSFSFSNMDERLSCKVEPGVPPPAERLAAMRDLHAEGFAVGMMLMPVLPGLSDGVEDIRLAILLAQEAGAEFVIFGGLTLKQGRQKEYFFNLLEKEHPELMDHFRAIYPPDVWGHVTPDYHRSHRERLLEAATGIGMPLRIPASLMVAGFEPVDRVILMLEHMDYMARLRGSLSEYGLAARTIAKNPEGLQASLFGPELSVELSEGTRHIVMELLEKETCSEYEELMSV